MSKRDDDSQADMEVGMTTAERRRRRRRGGGLRVPSDNVPRRSTPVVAPVPEDPSLAMSIAYSFTSDGSEPMHADQLGDDGELVDPAAPELISPVIDPVSGPVEQADFEMKTREMSAVDLEALGLDGATAGLSPDRYRKAERARRVEVRAASPDEDDVEVAEVTEDLPIRGRERLKTVALSDEDLEEVREAVRAMDTANKQAGAALVPPPMPASPVPTPVAHMPSSPVSMPPATLAPASGPMAPATASTSGGIPLAPMAHTPSGSIQMPPAPGSVTASSSGIRPLVSTPPQPMPITRQHPPTPQPGSLTPPPPRLHSPTPPPPVREARSAASEMWDEETPPPRLDASARAKPSADDSMAELDIQELDRAESSGEFEVDVDDAEEVKTAAADAGAARRPRPSTTPPPIAPSASTTTPGVPPPPAQPPAAAPQPTAQAAPPLAGSAQVSQAGQAAPGAQAAAASAKDPHAHHHPPPPPPAALHHKAPPAPPQPAKKDAPAAKAPSAAPRPPPAMADARPRGKPWFVEVFDEDYLRTLPFLTPQATQGEAEFVIAAMGLVPGSQVLDIGCGYGRHAMELAARGFHVVGLDLSTPLLLRGGEEAQRRGLQINFVRGDMRELDFDAQFDGAYCLFSTFGYFDDETNKRTVSNIARALKPGGRVLIEILNRDYVIADLPTRVWWEGDGCVVLEEVELNYFSSRIQVNRSVVFDDGRQLEQEISVRAYALHEVGKLMHAAGFRVLEVSGGYQTRGRFFGNQSRHIIVLAERKEAAG